MLLRNVAALDHSVELSLGRGVRLLGDVRDGGHGLVIDPESGEHAGQVPGLHVELAGLVGQGKHTQLAILKLFSGFDDVRNEESEATVIVQPPHVNSARPLLLLELLDLVCGLDVQDVTVGAPVDGGGDLPCLPEGQDGQI